MSGQRSDRSPYRAAMVAIVFAVVQAGVSKGEYAFKTIPGADAGHPLERSSSPNDALTWLEVVRAPMLRHDLVAHGASTCAAAACHGGAHPGVAHRSARRGAEYPIWLQDDPHARSWDTLCNDHSLEILRRLGIVDGDRIVDVTGYSNCLSCHSPSHKYSGPSVAGRAGEKARLCDRPENDSATTVFHDTSGRNGRTSVQEGVGCAACHGPDELWRSKHYRLPWDAETASVMGFVNNRDLLTRARVCASCHVGDTDRDVNHDLIAAGHPALRFDFATYHARLAKHWRDDSCVTESQLWLVGQIASLDASLALLETRGKSGHRTGRWPEFAEFSCADCHHPIGRPVDGASPSRGRASFSAWNYAGMEWLLQDHDLPEAPSRRALHQAIVELQSLMNQSVGADAVDVANQAKATRIALDAWLQSAAAQDLRNTFDANELMQLVDRVKSREHHPESWELAAQIYLAAVAGRAEWPDGVNGSRAEELRKWLAELRSTSAP